MTGKEVLDRSLAIEIGGNLVPSEILLSPLLSMGPFTHCVITVEERRGSD